MDIQGRKVVVTGGAGFIGSHVVDHLVRARDASVVVLDDLSVGTPENLSDSPSAELVVGSICDPAAVKRVVEGADLVLHMACDNLRASIENPSHTHEVNSTGTLTCALAAVEAAVPRFVYVSSSEAYGSGNASEPMTEEHPLRPTTVYGASKAAGELLSLSCMRTYGMPATVIRPFNSYGPREHAHGTSAEVIPKFASRILAGEAPVIFGDGTQTRDFTWVEETAAGIVAVAECDALVGQPVNVARGEAVTILEIAEILLGEIDGPALAPELSEERPGDVAHHWAETSRCNEATGFEAKVGIRDGLREYLRWLGDQGEHQGGDTAVRNW
jgi:UDP-glucose 4-epimerase